MHKKTISLILVALMLVMTFSGCSATPSEESPEAEAPAAEEPVEPEETVEPDTSITVTDQAGNLVTIDRPAERVVTGFYGQTYAMIALGLKDRLVAIEAKADERPIYGLAAPELMELPNVGTMKEFNVEAAIAMEPDIMLLPKRLQDNAEAFAAVGIPVAICDPESQELLEEMLTMIAALTGVPENADKLIAYYDEKFEEIEQATESISDKPTVYMAGNTEYLSTSPDSMYQAGLITKAGGENAASGIEGDYWVDISYEQLLNLDPDIIVLPSEAKYTPDDILNDPQLSELTAVKNSAVYAMPNSFDAWDSPGPSGVLGTLWMLATIHPDVYSIDQMRLDAADFYRQFYDFEIDPASI